MKTCSTCKHASPRIGRFECDKNSLSFLNYIAGIIGCIHHEEKREPLRLECECVWLSNHIGEMYPSEVQYELEKFKGKRTKMTLEEICE